MKVIKVLFVDDDQNVLGSFKRNLRAREEIEAGYAGGAREVFDLLGKEKFDVIVADYKMPEVNGIELLRKVQSEYPGMKRILLTGQSQEEVFKRSSEVADRYLSKPFEIDDIIEVIKSL